MIADCAESNDDTTIDRPVTMFHLLDLGSPISGCDDRPWSLAGHTWLLRLFEQGNATPVLEVYIDRIKPS